MQWKQHKNNLYLFWFIPYSICYFKLQMEQLLVLLQQSDVLSLTVTIILQLYRNKIWFNN